MTHDAQSLTDDDMSLFDDNGEALVSIKTFNRLVAIPGALAPVEQGSNGMPCLYGEEDYRDFEGTAESVLIKCRLADEHRVAATSPVGP